MTTEPGFKYAGGLESLGPELEKRVHRLCGYVLRELRRVMHEQRIDSTELVGFVFLDEDRVQVCTRQRALEFIDAPDTYAVERLGAPSPLGKLPVLLIDGQGGQFMTVDYRWMQKGGSA